MQQDAPSILSETFRRCLAETKVNSAQTHYVISRSAPSSFRQSAGSVCILQYTRDSLFRICSTESYPDDVVRNAQTANPEPIALYAVILPGSRELAKALRSALRAEKRHRFKMWFSATSQEVDDLLKVLQPNWRIKNPPSLSLHDSNGTRECHVKMQEVKPQQQPLFLAAIWALAYSCARRLRHEKGIEIVAEAGSDVVGLSPSSVVENGGSGGGVVYFMRQLTPDHSPLTSDDQKHASMERGQPIKIGFASDLGERWIGLLRTSHTPLAVAAYVRFDVSSQLLTTTTTTTTTTTGRSYGLAREVEKAFHKLLAPFQMLGEWFHLTYAELRQIVVAFADGIRSATRTTMMMMNPDGSIPSGACADDHKHDTTTTTSNLARPITYPPFPWSPSGGEVVLAVQMSVPNGRSEAPARRLLVRCWPASHVSWFWKPSRTGVQQRKWEAETKKRFRRTWHREQKMVNNTSNSASATASLVSVVQAATWFVFAFSPSELRKLADLTATPKLVCQAEQKEEKQPQLSNGDETSYLLVEATNLRWEGDLAAAQTDHSICNAKLCFSETPRSVASSCLWRLTALGLSRVVSRASSNDNECEPGGLISLKIASEEAQLFQRISTAIAGQTKSGESPLLVNDVAQRFWRIYQIRQQHPYRLCHCGVPSKPKDSIRICALGQCSWNSSH